jgi:hypothetical protein
MMNAIAKVMKDDVAFLRDKIASLEEKNALLREALSILEQQIDYGQVDVALDYVRAILEKTK